MNTERIERELVSACNTLQYYRENNATDEEIEEIKEYIQELRKELREAC